MQVKLYQDDIIMLAEALFIFFVSSVQALGGKGEKINLSWKQSSDVMSLCQCPVSKTEV